MFFIIDVHCILDLFIYLLSIWFISAFKGRLFGYLLGLLNYEVTFVHHNIHQLVLRCYIRKSLLKNKNRRHEDYAKVWEFNVSRLTFTSIYSSVNYYFVYLLNKLLTKESTVLIFVFVCFYPFTFSLHSWLAIMQNGKTKYRST